MTAGRKRHATRAAIQRRQRMLECACRCFADAGYEGASMDAIARSAGVAKMTLYAHFGDKQGLFDAVIAHHLEQLPDARLNTAASPTDLRARLRAIARDLIAQDCHPSALVLARTLARSTHLPRHSLEERIRLRHQPHLHQLELLFSDHGGRIAALAARQFVTLVVGGNDPAAAAGLTEHEALQNAENAVAVFASAYGQPGA